MAEDKLTGALAYINKLRKEENTLKQSQEKESRAKEDQKNNDVIDVLEVSPKEIKNWDMHDRPEDELGNIEALSKDLQKIGQIQPCIVRPLQTGKQKYELIVGERRWRAAILANIKVKIIVIDLTDNEAALAQSAENNNREDLSDYAKGMSYSKFISAGIIKQKDIVEKLGVSRQYVSALLSFSKIPEVIRGAIGNMANISASSAEKIKQISDKGEEYIDALTELCDILRKGKIGPKKIESLVMEKIHGQESKSHFLRKVKTLSGHHIFTWRQDNNSLPSIHFPKDIGQLIQSGRLPVQDLSEDISKLIEGRLNELGNLSGQPDK